MAWARLSIWTAAIAAAVVTAAAQPTRVVSLNLCADQLVLASAPPEHVQSVTWLTRDCNISGCARPLPSRRRTTAAPRS